MSTRSAGSGGVLDGVRVIELASVVSGPFGGLMLAQLGADVVKVESPTGDVTRSWGPRHNDVSAYFSTLNGGKRSIVVDLQTEQGVTIVRELVAGADVLVENWRPGVATRLGLDADELRANHPPLVTVGVRGFGDDGPYAADKVYDPVIQGVSGLAGSQADERGPRLVQTVLPDKLASMALVQGVLGALLERTRTGRGRHVSVNMLDTTVAFLWPDVMRSLAFVDAEGRGHGPGRPARTSTVVRAADGWIATTVITDAEWRAMCDVAGNDDLYEAYRGLGVRAESIDAVAAALGRAFADRPRAEVLAALRERGVPCGPVHMPEDVLDDPQVRANGLVREVDVPGLGRVREVASPVPLDAPGSRTWVAPAPALGEHTDEVLADLGHGPDAVAALRAAGVVA